MEKIIKGNKNIRIIVRGLKRNSRDRFLFFRDHIQKIIEINIAIEQLNITSKRVLYSI